MRVCFARLAGGVAAAPGGVAILEQSVMRPLILRTRRKGDTLQTSGGATSVKELLDRWGVGEPERDRIPLLADRRGVLAVLGSALGYGSRIREGAHAEGRGTAPRIVVHIARDAGDGREEGT